MGEKLMGLVILTLLVCGLWTIVGPFALLVVAWLAKEQYAAWRGRRERDALVRHLSKRL